MPTSQLLYFEDYKQPAIRLAKQLGMPGYEVKQHRFPDGESHIQLPDVNTEHLLICYSLNNPNDKLIELMLVCHTARNMGIKRLSLIAPYLCYMRQDKAFHQGEAVSQKIIGQYLAELFDDIITVDAHLHRTPDLKSAVPCKQALNLLATKPLGQFLLSHKKSYVLIGPDEESEQWVSALAGIGQFDYMIAAKKRLSDKQVEISLPGLDVHKADAVLVDDMISTGHTMLETAKILFAGGANSVSCLTTHGLMNDKTIQMLSKAGIENIWSTDSILSQTSCIQLDSLLAEGIRLLRDD